MVIIDQLRISDDGKRMYINIHVNTASYFDNIYLDEITIMTSDKVSETSPNLPTSDYIYHYQFTGNRKEAGLVLKAEDFIKTWEDDPQAMHFSQADMSTTLFFVYIKCKGYPDPCTPCSLDEEITVGVTFDLGMLYQRVMGYTKKLAQDCSINQGFSDFILLWHAFKAAIETDHYVAAIKFFNMMFLNVKGSVYVKSCGCHE